MLNCNFWSSLSVLVITDEICPLLIIYYIFHFSIKLVTQSIKDEDKSPLFTKSGKLSGLSQNIYDLLLCGLRGNLKKDAVLSALRDIAVRINFVIMFKIWFFLVRYDNTPKHVSYYTCKNVIFVYFVVSSCWYSINYTRCFVCDGCWDKCGHSKWRTLKLLPYCEGTRIIYIWQTIEGETRNWYIARCWNIEKQAFLYKIY